MEIKLSDEHIKIFSEAMIFSPIFNGDNLTCFKVGSEIMFNNPNLSQKVIGTHLAINGEQIFYDIVRKDGKNIDVDRRLMSLDRTSASGAFIQSIPIKKDFEWHHNPPKFYLN